MGHNSKRSCTVVRVKRVWSRGWPLPLLDGGVYRFSIPAQTEFCSKSRGFSKRNCFVFGKYFFARSLRSQKEYLSPTPSFWGVLIVQYAYGVVHGFTRHMIIFWRMLPRRQVRIPSRALLPFFLVGGGEGHRNSGEGTRIFEKPGISFSGFSYIYT